MSNSHLSEARSRHDKGVGHRQHGVELGLLGDGGDELAGQAAPDLQAERAQGERKGMQIGMPLGGSKGVWRERGHKAQHAKHDPT